MLTKPTALNWSESNSASLHQTQGVSVRYREGYGALRNTLAVAAQSGFEALVTETKDITKPGKTSRFQAAISVKSRTRKEPSQLIEAIADLPGVLSVEMAQPDYD